MRVAQALLSKLGLDTRLALAEEVQALAGVDAAGRIDPSKSFYRGSASKRAAASLEQQMKDNLLAESPLVQVRVVCASSG